MLAVRPDSADLQGYSVASPSTFSAASGDEFRSYISIHLNGWGFGAVESSKHFATLTVVHGNLSATKTILPGYQSSF